MHNGTDNACLTVCAKLGNLRVSGWARLERLCAKLGRLWAS